MNHLSLEEGDTVLVDHAKAVIRAPMRKDATNLLVDSVWIATQLIDAQGSEGI